jgi:hypothetical protein
MTSELQDVEALTLLPLPGGGARALVPMSLRLAYARITSSLPILSS